MAINDRLKNLIESRKADKKYEFNVNKFCSWTAAEKNNIQKFREYEKLEWFIESTKLGGGLGFGDEALVSGN